MKKTPPAADADTPGAADCVLLGVLAAIDAASFEAMQKPAPNHRAGLEAYCRYMANGVIPYTLPTGPARRDTERRVDAMVADKLLVATRRTQARCLGLPWPSLGRACQLIGNTLADCLEAMRGIADAAARAGFSQGDAVPVPDFVPELADLGDGYANAGQIGECPGAEAMKTMEAVRAALLPGIAARWVRCWRTTRGFRLYSLTPDGWAALKTPPAFPEDCPESATAVEWYLDAWSREVDRLQAARAANENELYDLPLAPGAWSAFVKQHNNKTRGQAA